MMWVTKKRCKELWEHLRGGPNLAGAGVRGSFLEGVELGPKRRIGLGQVKREREGRRGRRNSRYNALRRIRGGPLLWKDREQGP